MGNGIIVAMTVTGVAGCVAILLWVAMRSARRDRLRRQAGWKHYGIRHRVLRDLGRIFWGPLRLPDLRDRSDESR